MKKKPLKEEEKAAGSILSKTSSFFNSSDSYGESDLIILGIPMDYTASNIPGSRFAPKRIRELSYTLENYSPFFDDYIDEKFYDIGDIVMPWGKTTRSLYFETYCFTIGYVIKWSPPILTIFLPPSKILLAVSSINLMLLAVLPHGMTISPIS